MFLVLTITNYSHKNSSMVSYSVISDTVGSVPLAINVKHSTIDLTNITETWFSYVCVAV